MLKAFLFNRFGAYFYLFDFPIDNFAGHIFYFTSPGIDNSQIIIFKVNNFFRIAKQSRNIGGDKGFLIAYPDNKRGAFARRHQFFFFGA